jgi:hypothetical protein
VVFPNLGNDVIWSASPYDANANYAWGLFFVNGGDLASSRNVYYRVRLVRAGQ